MKTHRCSRLAGMAACLEKGVRSTLGAILVQRAARAAWQRLGRGLRCQEEGEEEEEEDEDEEEEEGVGGGVD